MRELFEAAGCPRVVESGEGKRRNVECVVDGASGDVILVGTSQRWDSLGSLAMLPSLMEAIAAAPRRHGFRFVAFSAHEAASERVNRVQKPVGAMRLLDSLDDAERQRIRVMVHVGPLGFGAVDVHPDRATDGLRCAFEAAAKAAPIEIGHRAAGGDCVGSGATPQSTSRDYLDCRRGVDWTGSKDWEPFLRRGLPVFGVHSAAATLGGSLDPGRYVRSYRLMAIFLALADDALAEPAAPSAPTPAATSSR
jgi:hypothetical protein